MNIHASARAIVDALEPALAGFAADVIEGLGATAKQLPPKYFYDAAGSDLFEQITRLPEYYPTRAEMAILRRHGAEIAATVPAHAALIEFGAGAATKIRLLLQAGLAARLGAYVPVDISGEFVLAQSEALRQDWPALSVNPVVADFTTRFELPAAIAAMPRAGFFPGSTLGNFEPDAALAFLRGARQLLGAGATLIIGIDLEKDVTTLERAYDDAAGVTARFNMNVLRRINQELGADFDLAAFTHRALYNTGQHRIEMHLVSRREQAVNLLGERFTFRRGETIHTENSYKYSIPRFKALAAGAGWQTVKSWTDSDGLFSVHALRA